jgi:serine/threonine protein kinase
LIEPIAAYQIGQDRCLIFPWASGGNLGDYWKECEEKSQESNSVKWIVRQFVGICSVLEKLHDINCRHGDLKPENILWFRDDNDMGKLQIADLGLAKFHDQEAHTNVRQEKDIHTSSPSGTSRYEPPEMDQERRNRGEARSRRYDVWSMGCIMFELLIWLTSGYQAVEKLRKETEYFWKLEQNQQKDVYVVHPYVVSRMDIMGTQLLNNTAYKELLHLVRTKLLVVDLSETSESPGKYREFAKGICLSINDIQKKCQSIPLYLKPVQLEYPSDLSIAIASKPVVYSNEKGLTTPTRPDIPRTPQTLPSSPTERAEEHGPKIVVSAPMSDTNADSSTEQISSHMDHHHEVGELNHLRSKNL